MKVVSVSNVDGNAIIVLDCVDMPIAITEGNTLFFHYDASTEKASLKNEKTGEIVVVVAEKRLSP